MSAKTTGAEPNGAAANGSAKNRTHHDGRETRAFTEDQKLAVIRVRKCGPTAFYDILGLESEKTTVDDAGIKRAYRKLSLLTHPDKNGYEGADEAFKMVSRAFQILSDPDKKKRYDQFGGDPDNRFSSSSAANPFSGFARSAGGGMRQGGMFEEEMSPEELFRQFFGGGLGGGFGGPFGGGLFDNGPGFVFNVGGGPGIRIHQFGGNRPRRRPPGARGGPNGEGDPETQGVWSAFQALLPLLLFVAIPLLSSLLSGSFTSSTSSQPKVPAFNIDNPAPPLTHHHVSRSLQVSYYVNPVDITSYGPREWRKMDDAVERRLLLKLQHACEAETRERDRIVQDAQGWFFPDEKKIEQARALPMTACRRYNSLIQGRGYYL